MKIIKESDIQKDTKYMVRIAKYGEFDNGRVLRNYRKMYPDDAEKLAKQASEKDPNNIYYVYYGDIMLDGSDLRWINGKSYHYSQVKMTPDGPVIKESKIIKESDILKDLNDIIDFKKGFSNFDSLEKYLNSKGYEVADNGDDYIDIASPDGYRYSFDFDYSSEAPGGRLSIGSFIDRDKE